MEDLPVFGTHSVGHDQTRRRLTNNGESTGHHRINEATVNPYETFTIDQALCYPRREKDWKHEMRYQIQKVEDNLFIGPWVAAKRLENVYANEITHVLAVMQPSDLKIMKAARAYHGVEYNYNGRQGCLGYAELEFSDRKWVPIRSNIQTFTEALEEARRCGGNLLVYCLQGISLSPTLIIGYLMMSRRLKYLEGYRWLHSLRFCIHPNEGFVAQLMDLEKLIKAEDVTGAGSTHTKRRADDDELM